MLSRITQALNAVGQESEIREVPNWDRGEILKLTNGSYYQVPVIQFEDRTFTRAGLIHSMLPEEWIISRPQVLEKAVQLLRPFEIMLADAPFLLGDVPVYSDFALFGILENLVYGEWVEIPKELVRIKEWRETLRRFRYMTIIADRALAPSPEHV